MVDGLAAAGFDVLNVTLHDLPWLGAQPSWPLGAVSANITAPDGRAPPTHRVFTRDGLRVAVTGVTVPGLEVMQPLGFGFTAPADAIEALLPTLRAEADVVVVLAFGLGPDAKRVAALPGVDVLIEADGFGPRMEAFSRGEMLWARANAQTETLGELRLEVAEGRVIRAVDRAIDLDPSLASRADLARATRRTRKQAAAALAEVLAGELVDAR